MLTMLAVLLVAGQTPAHEGSLTVADVLDAWEDGAELITSYDLEIEHVASPFTTWDPQVPGNLRPLRPGETSTPRTSTFRVMRLGEKRRGEFSRDNESPVTMIYDGEVVQIHRPAVNQVGINSGVIIFGATEYGDYERAYRTVSGTLDRIQMTRERQSRLLPRDGRLYVVEAPPLGEKGSPEASAAGVNLPNVGWRVWLDPERNFMPVKLYQWFIQGGSELPSLECVGELEEVVPGVWAPMVFTIRVFNKTRKSPVFGKCTSQVVLRVLRDKSSFNQPLDETLFHGEIPIGAMVIDGIRNVTYLEGSADPDGYLRHLAQEGVDGIKSLPPTARLQPPSLVEIPTRSLVQDAVKILSALVVVSLLVLGVVMTRRYLRPHRE